MFIERTATVAGVVLTGSSALNGIDETSRRNLFSRYLRSKDQAIHEDTIVTSKCDPCYRRDACRDGS